MGKDGLSEPLPHPPGVARRTASIAIQTSGLKSEVSEEPSHKVTSPVVSSEEAVSVMYGVLCGSIWYELLLSAGITEAKEMCFG